MEAGIEEGRFLIVTAAVVFDCDGSVFVAQRQHSKHLGMYWEFPGGKAEQGETLEECLRREMEEEFSVTLDVGARVFMVDQPYEDIDVRLCALRAKIASGEPTANEHGDTRWVPVGDLLALELAPADIILARGLAERLAPSGSD